MTDNNDDAPVYGRDRDSFIKMLGSVAWTWSRLHATFGQLFVSVLRPANREVGVAIWTTQKSDQNAREMLRAALAKADNVPPALRAEIEFLLKEVKDISEYRNLAMHVAWEADVDPIGGLGDDWREVVSQSRIRPNGEWSPRANKLSRAPTLRLFSVLALYCRTLNMIALHCWLLLEDSEHQPAALPKRPKRPKLLRESSQESGGASRRARRRERARMESSGET